jgi:hypothetical protein
MGMDITFNIKGPKNGINAIRDVMPENIVEFTGVIDFETNNTHEVKFRV